MRNGVIRTVRDGAVLIGGVRYRPEGQYRRYDGRLDGLRFLFGRYPAPWKPAGYEPFVSLCVGEAEFRAADPGAGPGPEVVDGVLPWSFWYAEG